MSKYKQYDEDFKKTIVSLYENGRSATDLAREYDLSVKNIYNWRNLYGTIKAEDGTTTNNKEILELKKENSRLQQEVEILKKQWSYSRKNRK